MTQGLADLSLIPISEGEAPAAEASEEVNGFIAFLKDALKEEVSDVRASERLTESPVCLVASEHGMDRQLERLLAASGRAGPSTKPILELNPRHDLVVKLSALGEDVDIREDAAHLLLDEARIADGELPADLRGFSARLERVLAKALA